MPRITDDTAMRIVIAIGMCLACVVVARAEEKKAVEVVFSAMGCGPYTIEAEKALAHYIALENSELPKSSFLVHCGDIVTSKNKNWPEERYENVASLLRTANGIPTFIVPGDNEWNDQENPDLHWGYWTRHFLRFDANWPVPGGGKTERQQERVENFAFVLNGVLFIGINHVGGRIHDADEWKARHHQNSQWIGRQFSTHREKVRAAVVFAQASADRKAPRFLPEFRGYALSFKKPVLYLHADGHKWFVRSGEWAPNVMHVQLDVVNAQFPPVQVTVTMDPEKPFVFARRLKEKRWKVKSAGSPVEGQSAK
jgi:hypothetical protein